MTSAIDQHRSRQQGTATILELPAGTALDQDAVRERAITTLEGGGVVYLPQGGFELSAREKQLVADASVMLPTKKERESRNGRPTVVYDPDRGHILHARMKGEPRAELEALMARYTQWADGLVRTLFPSYSADLVVDRLTYRPCERSKVQGLHVDASYGRPTEGRSMLRVFCNINPQGRPRVWHVGESFEPFVSRYLPTARIRPESRIESLLGKLGITRGKRTAYDRLMEDLRARGKKDDRYQSDGPRRVVEFPTGAVWIAITDLVMHAAVSGQHSFDQTFFVPIRAMRSPANSSLAILERLTGQSLA